MTRKQQRICIWISTIAVLAILFATMSLGIFGLTRAAQAALAERYFLHNKTSFQGDLDYKDGTIVPVGKSFEKTFPLRNDGPEAIVSAGAVKWYLKNMATGTKTPIPDITVGVSCKVKVTVPAPKVPGWYLAPYRVVKSVNGEEYFNPDGYGAWALVYAK